MKDFFTSQQLECNCGCGNTITNVQFLQKLNQARRYSCIPYVITSGYRCSTYNQKVGGVTDSAHTKGIAVDIAYKDLKDLYKIMSGLLLAGIIRIGINFNKKFVHVDMDKTKPNPSIFTY